MTTATEVRERPILFSGPMVRAILEGKKTQTRRVMKPAPPARTNLISWNTVNKAFVPWRWFSGGSPAGGSRTGKPIDCPYGQPGDRLYVRETWGVGCRPCPRRGWVDGIEYRADEPYLEGPDLLHLNSDVAPPDDFEWDAVKEGWKPSIHMPRWASRIDLEVTGVRVERVQQISEADAVAEGVQMNGPVALTDRTSFARLWDSINAKRGYDWNSDPWVWVVDFSVGDR